MIRRDAVQPGLRRSNTGRGSPASSRARDRAASDYYDVWYHVAWVLYQAAQSPRGPADAPGHHATRANGRHARDEGEVSGPARPALQEVRDLTHDTHRPRMQRSRLLLAALASAVVGSSWPSRADDVSLIPGNTVKQAIGGRVRGAVQSETPTEVVVTLGSNTTTVPTDRSPRSGMTHSPPTTSSARPAKRPASLPRRPTTSRRRRPTHRGRPFPHQAALFREAHVLGELAMVEPERLKEAREAKKFIESYPGAATPPLREAPGANPDPIRRLTRAPRPRSRRWPGCPRSANEPRCSALGSWHGKGSTTRPSPSWIA